jgi:hypothetical protein
MTTWLRDQFLTVYDYHYVDETLLGTKKNKAGVCKFLDEIHALLKELDEILTPGGNDESSSPKEKTLTYTKTQPFALTKPKPRPIPEPKEVYETTIIAKPVPDSLNSTSLIEIEKKRIKAS